MNYNEGFSYDTGILPGRRKRTFFGNLWSKMMKATLLPVLFVGGLVSVIVIPTYVKRWQLRDVRPRAMQVTMQQGEPLIAAIKNYTKADGKPPPDLNTLIPRYLQTLPDAGPMAKDGWHYKVSEETFKGGWALYVKVPQSMSDNSWLSFGDYFVYHPSEHYEKYGYGGGLVRIGTWGYYYE